MSASKVSRGTLLPKLAAIGSYAKNAIVRHVGMAVDDATAGAAPQVIVYDCQPPLRIGPGREELGAMRADVVGHLDLTDKEKADVEMWLAREQTRILGDRRRPKLRYTVLPAARFRTDAVNGQTIYRDFSCAGFVATAYSEGANITLVDETNLPTTTAARLAEVYTERYVELARKLDFGLTGDGPWPVLLPGYLFHALNRSDPRAGPHIPTATDATFP